jgi:hypothetical protein
MRLAGAGLALEPFDRLIHGFQTVSRTSRFNSAYPLLPI